MLAPASVCESVEIGMAVASPHRAKADVIHLRYCLFVAKPFILLHKLLSQTHALNIVVTETLAARSISALDRGDLSVIHFENNHILHAIEAEKVVAAREKEEFFSKKLSSANITRVLLVIELPLERF